MRTNEAAWLEKYDRWQIKVQKEGVRKTFTSSISGKKGKIECEKNADKWLEKSIVNTNIRFKEAYKAFLEEKKQLSGKENFTKLESIGRCWLMPELGHKRISTITQGNIQKIIIAAYHKGKSKKTLQNIKATATTFATFCRKQEWPAYSTEFVEIPRNAPTKKKIILQPCEMKLLFEDNDINLSEFYIYAFRFMVLTGLRRGELCGLQNDDIYGTVAHISRSINRLGETTNGKTRNAVRSMAICSKAVEALNAQKQRLKKMGIISPYVFPSVHGTPTQGHGLYNSWYDHRKKLGLSCNLHELRHTLISYASASVPETLLKKTVGHSKSMDTFGIYTHAVDDEAERVAALLDERFIEIL